MAINLNTEDPDTTSTKHPSREEMWHFVVRAYPQLKNVDIDSFDLYDLVDLYDDGWKKTIDNFTDWMGRPQRKSGINLD